MTARRVISVLLGILLICVGISCFATPIETSTVLPLILGIFILTIGVGRAVAWFNIRQFSPQSGWILVGAIVSAMVGLILAASPILQVSFNIAIMVFTGIWLAALGIIRIVHAYRLGKLQRQVEEFWMGAPIEADWRASIIPGVILLIAGIVLLFKPTIGLGIISAVIGIGVITSGINLIFLGTRRWMV